MNPSIRSTSSEDPEHASPASFTQRRLWFLERLAPGSPLYNMPAPLELRGMVDADLLERAIGLIVDRHEVLRTIFESRRGVPYQIVTSARPKLERVDLTATTGDRETRLAEALAEASTRPFDLARGPLLRCTLFRSEPERHVLLVNMHHIVADGWSMGIFFRELRETYVALLERRNARLPALPMQYRQWSELQHLRLAGPERDRLLAFFREALAGAPPVIELPLDRPRPVAASGRGAHLLFSIPAPELQPLLELVRELRATPFMGLLAVFALLLGRAGNQRDLVIGTPIASRTHKNIEHLIGFFANTLALRIQLEPGMTGRDLLRVVADTTIHAFEHQELPFELLVEDLAPERHLSHNPVFQVMFVLQNDPMSARPSGSTHAEQPIHSDGTGTSKFDLTLYIVETADRGLRGSFEYNIDIFDRETVEQLAVSWRRLLGALAREPDRPVETLGLEDDAEAIARWQSRWTTSAAPEGSIIDPILEMAMRQPRAVAVVDRQESVSYEELVRAAETVAAGLRALGVGTGDRVAVCLPRQRSMVEVILGILFAGGAYVPIDMRHPKYRQAFAISDSQARLVIGSLPADVPTVTIEELLAAAGGARLRTEIHPEQLAYMIYTSGSTGQPKAVAVPHRAVAAMLGWAIGTYSARDLSAVLASTSLAFDISVFELFAPLWAGGTVVVVEDVLELLEAAPLRPLSLVNTVPSAARELLRAGALGGAPVLNVAGEALSATLARGLLGAGLRLYNLYGPTEDAVYSTYERVVAPVISAPAIGRPLTDTRAYVLDEALNPVPDGFRGQLYLGGRGNAWGYHGRTDLTAAAFLPDRLSPQPGARMYATGDVVSWRRDGTLEFHGRIDQQVKHRGYRIEPGEIEAALEAHPDVIRAVVGLRGRGDRPMLVAWYQGEAEVSAVRAHILGRLPEYMVPEVWCRVAAFPATTSGKIDRARLPPPEVTEPTGGEPPRDALEKTISEIWSQVLGSANVARDDDFFAIGGQSLLATQVAARLSEMFQPSIGLRDLFQFRTLAGLAGRMREVGARPREAAPTSAGVPKTPGEARALLGQLESLSTMEIARILKEMTRDQ